MKLSLAIASIALIYALFRMIKKFEQTQLELGLIAKNTSQSFGEQYFIRLADALGHTMRADAVWIAKSVSETDSKSVKILAGWTRQKKMEASIYELKDSPCELVYQRRKTVLLNDAKLTLPSSIQVPNIVTYMGIPLFSSQGDVEGHLALLSSKRLELEDYNRPIFRWIALRAATEIERQNVEERLRVSSRLAALGELSAGIAHEINNPLWIMSLQTQLIKTNKQLLADAPFLKERITEIDNMIERCSRIVKNLLVFARGSQLEKSTVDIRQVIKDAIEFVRKSTSDKEFEIEFDEAAHEILVPMNRTTLELALINILQNAASFSPKNGVVEVAVKLTNHRVQIKIKDSGPGIPESDKSRIFAPFFSTRRKHGGTGLGMSIAHRIIDDHKGDISIENNIDSGTLVIVSLPVNQSKE